VKNVNSQVEVVSAIKAKLEVYWSLIHQSSIITTLLDPCTKFLAFSQDDQPHARFTLQKIYDEYNSDNIQIALPRLTLTHSIFQALIQSTSSNN
ncbi:3979_t:CDS:1, partial [Ambispora gerdemannii]